VKGTGKNGKRNAVGTYEGEGKNRKGKGELKRKRRFFQSCKTGRNDWGLEGGKTEFNGRTVL